MKAQDTDLSQCLRHFPGAVVEIAPDGVVVDFNGRLPVPSEATVVGHALSEFLEPGSRDKWLGALADPAERPRRIELAFDEGHTYRLRAFSLLREPGPEGRLWLVEQPAELGEAPVYEELTALNAELAGAHRELARERARLERALHAEEEARQAAESSRRTLAVLEAIGELALGQRDLDLLLRGVLDRLREGLGVDVAVVLLLDEDGRGLTVRAAEGLPEAGWPTSVPLGSGVSGRVAASRQTVVVEDLAQAPYVNAFAREHLGSLAGAPMMVGDRLLGVLQVATLRPLPYPPEKVSLLRASAERLASAIERHRLWDAETSARAAAQAAVRQRDEVLAIVAHDLRNPLNRILMASGLLKEATAPDATDRTIEIVQGAVRAMDRLIRDLLDVSRLEAGGLRLDRTPVPVPALLGELCEQFEGVARSRDVRLTCGGGESLALVADRARLLQALSNLVDNALRLTPSGGAVSVAASRTRDYVEFAVRDTGPGIPADQLPHLFDRFWQGTRERRGSAGLGLAIVKGVVESHGGRVFVESRLGEGTTFRFWVPVP